MSVREGDRVTLRRVGLPDEMPEGRPPPAWLDAEFLIVHAGLGHEVIWFYSHAAVQMTAVAQPPPGTPLPRLLAVAQVCTTCGDGRIAWRKGGSA